MYVDDHCIPKQNFFETTSDHSHKKRIVLPTYVENQAMLELILLYRGSKCKQTKEQGSEDCLSTHTFYKIIVRLCEDANKGRSSCDVIGCNLSKKHKLTLYKTLSGEPNYVDHKFFFNLC